jgi:hypothetical protein
MSPKLWGRALGLFVGEAPAGADGASGEEVTAGNDGIAVGFDVVATGLVNGRSEGSLLADGTADAHATSVAIRTTGATLPIMHGTL